MRRSCLVLLAMLCLPAPSAQAARAYHASTGLRPRFFVSAGATFPATFSLADYAVGPGADLGLLLQPSPEVGFLVRVGYDHFAEDRRYAAGDEIAPGTADLANARIALRLTREQSSGRVGQSVEAGFGVAYESLSGPKRRDPVTQLETRIVERGWTPIFTLGGGTVYQPDERGPGYFIDTHLVFLLGGTHGEYVPVRIGITFP